MKWIAEIYMMAALERRTLRFEANSRQAATEWLLEWSKTWGAFQLLELYSE